MCSQSPYANAPSPPPPPPITLIDCHTGAWDYTITLQRPDGLQIKVLIPIEDGGYDDDCVSNPGPKPFGLNLVYSGHYT